MYSCLSLLVCMHYLTKANYLQCSQFTNHRQPPWYYQTEFLASQITTQKCFCSELEITLGIHRRLSTPIDWNQSHNSRNMCYPTCRFLYWITSPSMGTEKNTMGYRQPWDHSNEKALSYIYEMFDSCRICPSPPIENVILHQWFVSPNQMFHLEKTHSTSVRFKTCSSPTFSVVAVTVVGVALFAFEDNEYLAPSAVRMWMCVFVLICTHPREPVGRTEAAHYASGPSPLCVSPPKDYNRSRFSWVKTSSWKHLSIRLCIMSVLIEAWVVWSVGASH